MKTIAISILLSTLIASPSLAVENHTIRSPTGQTIFEARFFDPGDGPFNIEDGTPQTSSWAWRPELKPEIINGLTYWAEVIQSKAVDGNPTIINIGTDNEPDNAFGGSPLANGGLGPRTLLQHSLQGLDIDSSDLNAGSHGVFGLGDAIYLPSRLTQIPLSGHDDLFSTTIHELAHGLGATSEAEDVGPGTPSPAFGSVLAGWAPLMVDDNGNPARPGQAIWCSGCVNQADPAPFDVQLDQGMLVGRNIAEVLDGGLPGIPIKMLYEIGDDTAVDDNNMSHIELKNSVMSHQNYRNYKVFMEAELAVLQDLGYTIDRRNFFGRSIYGSGLDIVNNEGFFARNAAGKQYLHGQYNRSSLGLGLHVYGSHNRVRQVGDLLAAGAGGAGIRVDGEGNTIVIEPGTRVYANGLDGQGVMFTYGKNHVLVHRGDVEAWGARGVGLRFDFGSNGLGNAKEYRGSYIRTLGGAPAALLPELDGPLASQVDITGRVAAREAAIYISDNAYVGRINVMQGAKLEGDIVSNYAQTDGAGDLRLTTISFGQRADAQGRAASVADSSFQFRYTGNIRGKDNLTLSFDGGETSLNGTHDIHGATIQAGAQLSGNSVFNMSAGSLFSNQGALAPGNSIGTTTINGNFLQTSSGRLTIEFAANGDHDVLTVTGNADLAGSLELAPMADWYSSAWSAPTDDVVQAAAQVGGFDQVSLAPVSPTLGFSAVPLGGQRYMLAANRSADAYSQYSQDENGWAAGQALQRVADYGPSAAQAFFRALDFSALDGNEVTQALSLVSPAGYSAGLAASLQRERDVMDTALRGFASGLRAVGSQWKGYATAFGGAARQDARDSSVGYDATTYGLVVGTGRLLDSQTATSVAIHMDIADQSINLKTSQWGKGKSTTLGIGAHLQYQPDERTGPYAYGGLRFGVEQASMDRKVAVGDYYAAHSSDWTGHSMSAQSGFGYHWRLDSAWSAGPFMAVNYARVSRPGVNESGPAATRLYLDSQRMDALRSSIGMAASMTIPSWHEGEVTAHARIGWEHEWLGRDVTQTAAFAVLPAASFKTTNAVLPRDSVGLRAGLNWHRDERYTVGAEVGGQWGHGYEGLQGQLSMRWAF